MGVITTDFRVFWPLADADIPAGWERDNNYNAVYLLGDDTDATASGGSADHEHLVPAHALIGVAHTHVFRALTHAQDTTTQTLTGSPRQYAAGTHGHDDETSEPSTIIYDGGGLLPAFNTSTVSSHPPYIKMIIIKPVDGDQLVPHDAVTLYQDDPDPIKCKFTDGDNGTVDMRDRFILGADLAGDGGDTDGATTHIHTAEHDHDEDPSHTHDSNTAGMSDSEVAAGPPGADRVTVLESVHHGVDFAADSPADQSGVSVEDLFEGTGGGTNLPPYVRLAAIQNQAGRQALHPGMILGFVNTAVNLGADWLLCDGNGGTVDTDGKQIYIVNTKSQVGDVGGFDRSDHGHGIPAHQHVRLQDHDHNDTIDNEVITTVLRDSTPTTTAVAIHGRFVPHDGDHTWEIDDAEPTMAETASFGAAAGADGRMPFEGMLFVKYNPPTTVSVLGSASILGSTAIAAG